MSEVVSKSEKDMVVEEVKIDFEGEKSEDTMMRKL